MSVAVGNLTRQIRPERKEVLVISGQVRVAVRLQGGVGEVKAQRQGLQIFQKFTYPCGNTGWGIRVLL
jgi:hypothetical protein